MKLVYEEKSQKRDRFCTEPWINLLAYKTILGHMKGCRNCCKMSKNVQEVLSDGN
jgi:hypothetical protein